VSQGVLLYVLLAMPINFEAVGLGLS